MGSDDDAAASWLGRLRDGDPEEQTRALTELGLILERQGKIDEAAEAYYANVKARVRDPRPYERLAAISRQRGDDAYAERVLARMAKVCPAPTPQRPPVIHQARPGLFPVWLGLVAAGFVALGLIVIAGGAWATSNSPRIAQSQVPQTALAPTVAPAATQAAPPAIPTLTVAAPETCARAELQFPEWRDPEGAIQQVVGQIFRESGINPYLANPAVKRLIETYVLPPDDAVAGWMVYSLYWSEKGYASDVMSLSVYVQLQQRMRMALGSLARPDYLGPVLTREQWAEMQSWQISTCPGALLRNPDNTRLVRLMGKSVGDTAWLTRTGR